MKKNIFLLCLSILFIGIGYSQSKILKIAEGSKLIKSGVMMNSENSVDGYYFFYEVDKVSKKEREFLIKILDQNLNEVLNKSLIESKNTNLRDIKYNKQQLMLRMYNDDDYTFVFYNLDKTGILSKVFEYKEGISNYLYRTDNYVSMQGPTVSLFPIDNKGFLFYLTEKKKKFGYRMEYIATNGGKNWSYISSEDVHEITTILNVNEEGIIFQEIIRKKAIGGGQTANIKVLKPETGEVIFKKEYPQGEDVSQSINNAFVSNNELVVIGEYWGEKDRVYRDKSKGIIINKYSFSGEEVFNKKVEWKDGFDQKFNDLNDEEMRSFLFFHDFIVTKKGTIFAVAEQYRKTSKLTTATPLVVTDAFFIEFDKAFNLIDITKFDKGESRAGADYIGGPAQLQAVYLNRLGAFDYQYTQVDKKNDRFYSLFIDYERLKKEKDKVAFKAIIYNNGKLSEDKIYLEDNRSVETTAHAAKTGYVLLIDSDKKNKEVKLHLEKLNIK